MESMKRFFVRYGFLMILLLMDGTPLLADEGRIPIYGPPGQPLPITIAAPGSYILTRDITSTGAADAIIIAANNVTVDLNEHTISGTIFGSAISCTTNRTNIRITNGKISGFNYGINFQPQSSGTSAFRIDHISFASNNTSAITVSGFDQLSQTSLVVESNEIAGASVGIEGTFLRGVTISENTLADVSGEGIDISEFFGLSITRNSLANIETGIQFNNGQNATITQNTIANANSYGLFLESGVGLHIVDNLISYGSGTEIYLLDVYSSTIARNTATDSSGNGIVLESCGSNMISGNNFSGLFAGSGTGMQFVNSSQNNVIDDNVAVSRLWGITFGAGCSGNVYSNNRLSNNTSGNSFGTGNISAGGNNAGGANF